MEGSWRVLQLVSKDRGIDFVATQSSICMNDTVRNVANFD